ncbi:NAD(P)H-dependent oxidoreductase [Ilumatobacter nonamiensis]|uniref:NAD(P)H-dependent oxidoreductase n=1 Tax=Ilumatobacter nonamiensis TaxID=467093 RepID=UPI00034C28A3|nr:NAD(P)H-dependent oxidoreductase [Ilumatobacter nonamiensis]
MHVAVVLAHPNPDGFAHELASRAVAGLSAAGHEVELVDLYGMGFRAAMSAEERSAYHGERPILDPVVQQQVDLVRSVDALVFVYPTWWSGLPAILKGWLERVMVPGVGFRFDERSGKVRPGLTNIDHLIGISTYGSPRWYVRAINDNGRRTLLRALRLACGRRTSCRWFGLYGIDASSPEQRAEFSARVERELSELR